MLLTEALWRLAIDLSLVAAIAGGIYTVGATWLVLRYGRGRKAEAFQPVPVTILVPLCGDEPGLLQRLARLCSQDYPAPIQLICGLQKSSEAASACIEALRASYPDCNITLHVDPRLHGRNLKISNLMNMATHIRHDVLVTVDSDIEVGSHYLADTVAQLQQPDVGAVTCAYYGSSDGSLWGRLMAMGINLHFLPSVVVALRCRLARPCFGATIATMRQTLARIGGFGAFVDQLWDDYAIGEAIRDLGFDVAVTSTITGHLCCCSSAKGLLANEIRYGRTIKSIDPFGHAGAVITNPLPLALIGLTLGGGDPALGVVIAALICRLILCWSVERRFGTSACSYRLLPIRDLLSFIVYVVSFFGATVVWRGQRHRITPGGTLMPGAK